MNPTRTEQEAAEEPPVETEQEDNAVNNDEILAVKIIVKQNRIYLDDRDLGDYQSFEEYMGKRPGGMEVTLIDDYAASKTYHDVKELLSNPPNTIVTEIPIESLHNEE